MERFMKHLYILLPLAVTYNAIQDEWQTLNQGALSLAIAVNNKAVYAIQTSRSIQVVHNNDGFISLPSGNMKDITVNEDNDMWTTNIDNRVFYREGLSVTNFLGTAWTSYMDSMTGIATSRYGLVIACSSSREMYSRTGLTPSDHKGNGWKKAYGTLINGVSCTKRVCFATRENGELYCSGLMKNIDSPDMNDNWAVMDKNVLKIAAYGDKKLWKIDTNHVIWEAINVFDENMIHLNWVRRSYGEGNFIDVSVTDKYSFAIHSSGKIFIQTGCVIFDFEDNDISDWIRTGNAFEHQPVVSQQLFGTDSGKFGSYCIDTYSKRRTSDMPADSTTIQGDSVTGSILSPVFQIRSDMLHFAIGGGSSGNNIVELRVDNEHVRISFGNKRYSQTATKKFRARRYWWHVTEYKGKCAQIKITDASGLDFGYTVFDDLRSSPPCSKGMGVSLALNQTVDIADAGQRLRYVLKMEGFYTGSLRPLKINVSFPLKDNKPFAIIESMNVSWSYCNNVAGLRRDILMSQANGPSHIMNVTFTHLLSDAALEIIVRAYEGLRVGMALTAKMKVEIDFASDFSQVLTQNVIFEGDGRKAAKLILREEVVDSKKKFLIGDNITMKLHLSHSNSESLLTAYKATIRVLVPNYVTFIEVTGLNRTFGDIVDTQDSTATVRIPEIEMQSERSIVFQMRLDGDSNLIGKPGRNYSGHILLDAVYYCPRKECKNKYGNGSEVATLILSKFYSFNYQYKKALKLLRAPGIITRIGGNDDGPVGFTCVEHLEDWRGRCFYWNSTQNVWYGLSSVLRNVTYYDGDRMDLYGVDRFGKKLKVYGDRFEKQEMLSSHEWNKVASGSGAFIKAKYMTGKEVVVRIGLLKYQGYCCL